MFVKDISMHCYDYIVDYLLVCIYGVQAGLIHFLTVLMSIISILHLGSEMNGRPRMKSYARTNAIIIQIEIHISNL